MADSRPARGWRAQIAAGRVFELKRKTYRGKPVCVLITSTAERRWGHPMCIQVNEQGCFLPGDPGRARTWPGSLRLPDFTGKLVSRRRPELERFDAKDIEMIEYGLPMDFKGRLGRDKWINLLPAFPGVEWSIFWAPYDPVGSALLPPEVQAAFHGAWHLTSHYDGGYPRRRFKAWATAETDTRKLRAIHRVLAQVLPIQRGRVRIVARDMGEKFLIVPDGDGGPVFSCRWSSTISKRDGSRGFSCWST